MRDVGPAFVGEHSNSVSSFRQQYKKYGQYQREAALEESDSVIVEVTPVHVSAWGMD